MGSFVQEASDETHLLANFPARSSVSEFVLRARLVVLDKGGSPFLVLHCLGLLLPSQLGPNQVLHVVGLIFSLEIFFINYKERSFQIV